MAIIMKDICEFCGMSRTSETAKETVLDYINEIDPANIIINDYGVCIKTVNGSLINLTNCNSCNSKILKAIDLLNGGMDNGIWNYAV